MFFILILLILNIIAPLCADNNFSVLSEHNPFSYDLGIKIIPSENMAHNQVTICCHGYGHNNKIVDNVHSYKSISGTLIGFNFPDYNITLDSDHHKAAYGSIDEILPLLYILKCCIIDLNVPTINLYGFSAGGGAIINALATLNQTYHDESLEKISIFKETKKQLLDVLEKGLIILDCPLKSIEEIIALRGKIRELEILSDHYTKNNMNPIDVLNLLVGLNLNILLHFQNSDEILGNRDDMLFVERLKQANKGTTTVLLGFDGGHNTYHASLWNAYKEILP